MSKRMLEPQGQYPKAGIMRRLAAMVYDFMLVVALVMIVTWIYQQGLLRLIYGSEQLKYMADNALLDRDPILSSLLLLSIFAFFAKFWLHNGQTLGMQAWNIRIQNVDGSAIDLWQCLLRFSVSIILLGIFVSFTLWLDSEQILSMQAWDICVQNADGRAIDFWQCLRLFSVSIISWLALGLGFWWVLFNTWRDTYSESVIVQLPKSVHKK